MKGEMKGRNEWEQTELVNNDKCQLRGHLECTGLGNNIAHNICEHNSENKSDNVANDLSSKATVGRLQTCIQSNEFEERKMLKI
jgi:hypothetical protein